MKLAIRLQNKGVRNHPRWWVVVAPNRKNIFGKFIEHVGYWYPRQGIYVKRQIILNMARIKYWISCGAVPTKRVQYFLNWHGVMPKPWFFQKTEEELAKENDKGPEPTEKQKRKMVLKEKRKERQTQGIDDFWGRHRLVGKVNKYDKGKKFQRAVDGILNVQKKENEYLRELLMGEEMQKYLRVKELSGERVTNLSKLRDELDRVRRELAYIQENSKKMHPLKQSMLIERINEIYPQILQFEEQQAAKIKQMQNESLQEGVLGRAAIHELVMGKISKFNEDLKSYLGLLEPLTRESYAEYLMTSKNLPKNEAEAQATEDFDKFEQQGITLTKEDVVNPTHSTLKKGVPFFDEPVEHDKEYESYVDQMNYLARKPDDDAKIFLQQGKFRQAVLSGKLILPSKNPVNPYPDLSTYIPQDYYDTPPKKALVVNAPAIYPEEELERFLVKLALKKPLKGKTDLSEPV